MSGHFKNLTRGTAFDKILCSKAFNVAKNPKYDGYQSRILWMVYKCFDKKISGAAVKNKNNMQLISKFNQVLRFSLCVTDIYRKYTLFIPLKYKRGITITNAFRNF